MALVAAPQRCAHTAHAFQTPIADHLLEAAHSQPYTPGMRRKIPRLLQPRTDPTSTHLRSTAPAERQKGVSARRTRAFLQGSRQPLRRDSSLAREMTNRFHIAAALLLRAETDKRDTLLERTRRSRHHRQGPPGDDLVDAPNRESSSQEHDGEHPNSNPYDEFHRGSSSMPIVRRREPVLPAATTCCCRPLSPQAERIKRKSASIGKGLCSTPNG